MKLSKDDLKVAIIYAGYALEDEPVEDEVANVLNANVKFKIDDAEIHSCIVYDVSFGVLNITSTIAEDKVITTSYDDIFTGDDISKMLQSYAKSYKKTQNTEDKENS